MPRLACGARSGDETFRLRAVQHRDEHLSHFLRQPAEQDSRGDIGKSSQSSTRTPNDVDAPEEKNWLAT
jgi:hypothetical protein